MDNPVINNCGTGDGPSNICAICGLPFAYVGDVSDGGFIKGCGPYCTCGTITGTSDNSADIIKGVHSLALASIVPETLKDKIYRIAYIQPGTHPDRKLDKLYNEIIEDIYDLLRRK